MTPIDRARRTLEWYANNSGSFDADIDCGERAKNCLAELDNTEKQPRFTIGQQFKTRGKNPRLCTVTDILKTYNSRGELVKIRYVATHEFCGQIVTEQDVCGTTIAMGALR